jgi:hypothetical protein
MFQIPYIFPQIVPCRGRHDVVHCTKNGLNESCVFFEYLLPKQHSGPYPEAGSSAVFRKALHGVSSQKTTACISPL